MEEFSYQNLARKPLNVNKMPPVIITCAITGGNHGKEANPNLPETPEEQAQSAYEAYQAGASMVHIHCRQPDNPAAKSISSEDYLRVNRMIREKCPDIIINNTGGGGAGMTIEQKFAPVFSKPEVQSIDLTCIPLYMTYKARKAPLFGRDEDVTIDEPFTITFKEAEMGLELMKENGVLPEYELYDTNNYNYMTYLMNKGLIKAPFWIQFVLGHGTGSMGTLAQLLNMLDYVPEGGKVSVIGCGVHQFPMLAAAMALGCHVRVGMEDNIYISRGQLAESNAQLVEKAVDLAKAIGRPVATPAQAREIIGLPAEPRQY